MPKISAYPNDEPAKLRDLFVIARSGANKAALLSNYSKNLRGENNSGTPNTQYDFTTDEGTITNDVGLAGPVANGRDQAGAFSASSWIYFYWIWNGTAIATISSASDPSTGPTLPTGYTHWDYMCAIRFNGSSQLVATKLRGHDVYYIGEQTVVNGGTTTGAEQTVDSSAFIPPNAGSFFGKISYLCAHGTPGTNFQVDIRIVSGTNFLDIQQAAQVNSVTVRTDTAFRAPNINQELYYLIQTVAGSTQNVLYIICNGYTVPNGAS